MSHRKPIALIAVLACACGYRSSLLDRGDADAGLPDAGAVHMCAPPSVTMTVGPEVECVSMEVQGGGNGEQGCWRENGWTDATWVQITREGNLPAWIHIDLLEFPAECEYDVPSRVHTCPNALLAAPGEAPCECRARGHDDINAPGTWPHEVTSEEDFGETEMWPRVQDLYLKRSEARYRVTVCTRDEPPWAMCRGSDPEPDPGRYPQCRSAGILSDAPQNACHCIMPCAIDDDCHVPDTGDAVPDCRAPGACVLPCDASTTCPDGTRCVEIQTADFGVRLGVVVREWICAEESIP